MTTSPPVVEAWVFPGLLFERHRYAPGGPGVVPLHDHDAYQLGFSPDFAGEYRYRRASHRVPRGALSVIHPGEPHSARDLEPRERTVTFPMIYVAPAWVRDAIPGHRDALPYFAEPVAVNPSLAGLYHRCYAAVMSGNALARESLLLRLLAAWFDRHGERSTMARPHSRARPQVQRVRDFLHSFPERNVSLRQLAEIAALSPYHLLRVFSADLGMPPHRYLTQLRVWRAARLLAEGRSISDTALAVGFADQSHLTRHFKRHTGITPGRYQPRSASR